MKLDNKLKENTQKWFQFINSVRLQMQKKGYEEVITPNLVLAGAMESQLEPFKTRFNFGSSEISLQLPTSPEFHLKKLLGLGWGSLFEIKPCFRNEELSPTHRPEFTMLEFYKLGTTSKAFMDEVHQLILEIRNEQGKVGDLKTKRVSIAELFKDIGVILTPEMNQDQIKKEALRLGVYTQPDDDFNEIYFRIWLEKIEPNFPPDELVYIYNFPPSQAALAEINAQGWADRFEVFWQGFELGNAFKEMRDGSLLRQRYISENAKRQSQGLEPHPIDEELIGACENLPECSGIAIGMERLFMAIHGYKSISDFKILDLNEIKNKN